MFTEVGFDKWGKIYLTKENGEQDWLEGDLLPWLQTVDSIRLDGDYLIINESSNNIMAYCNNIKFRQDWGFGEVYCTGYKLHSKFHGYNGPIMAPDGKCYIVTEDELLIFVGDEIYIVNKLTGDIISDNVVPAFDLKVKSRFINACYLLPTPEWKINELGLIEFIVCQVICYVEVEPGNEVRILNKYVLHTENYIYLKVPFFYPFRIPKTGEHDCLILQTYYGTFNHIPHCSFYKVFNATLSKGIEGQVFIRDRAPTVGKNTKPATRE